MVVAGLVGAVVLSLSMTGTMSAFVAAITNSTNTAAVGTMSLLETAPNGTTTCTGTSATAATCATINKYGGNLVMVPGTTVSANTVTFKNPGTTAANTFTLTPAPCVSTPTPTALIGDLCTKLKVVITSGSTNLYTGFASALTAAITLTVPTPNGALSTPVTFTVSVDASADNTFQGTSASQPLTWTLST